MFKIMKIEWNKNKISKYITFALISMVVISALIVFLAIVSKQENQLIFINYAMYLGLSNSLIAVSCTILSGVLIARLIIEEYANNTIQLLFTYPVSRYKIICSKLLITFIFTLFNVVISTIVVNIVIYVLNPYLNLLEFNFNLGQVYNSVASSLINGIGISGVSFIALYFGMKKKSVAATISSACLIAIILNSSLPAKDGVTSIGQFVFVSIGLALLGMFIAFITTEKLVNEDLI